MNVKKNTLVILSMFFLFFASAQTGIEGFVEVDKHGEFMIDGKPYVFMGANYWQGMNLGAPLSGDSPRLIRELDRLKALGITNLRVLAASEADDEMKFAIHPALQTAPGVYDEDIWQGLDILLIELRKRNMKAVMVLGNFWTWSGGFPQYLKWSGAGEIPFPQEEAYSWQNFTDYSKLFYTNSKAQKMMNDHIKKVINRKNSISGGLYKDDPTIMAWQLSNEPRAYDTQEVFVAWTRKTSAYIKTLDPNHLVCLGTEGNTAGKDAGVDVYRDNNDPNVDYITMHIWPQNWGWFDPSQGEEIYRNALKKVDAYWEEHIVAAKSLRKPIVLEEFGIARDNSSFSPEAGTQWRDHFFGYLFQKVAKSIKENEPVKGLNFWSYSGEVKPDKPGEFWKKGDPLLGDPPHELQGWYGVYDTDQSTLGLIKAYSEIINP